jgi:hypothetical protein
LPEHRLPERFDHILRVVQVLHRFGAREQAVEALPRCGGRDGSASLHLRMPFLHPAATNEAIAERFDIRAQRAKPKVHLSQAPRLPMFVQEVAHMSAHQQESSTGFELRFDPLTTPGQSLAFPCDAQGQVDLNNLSNRARCDYLFARALIGRDFTRPAVHAH